MISPGLHSLRDIIHTALHDAEHGYYARHIRSLDRRGDFSTAATLGTGLARAMTGWLRHASRASGIRQTVEIGAGDGNLASNILRTLPWWHPLRRHYHIVDTSPVLVEAQRTRLRARVRWHASLPDALTHCGGRAHLFANELIDAFPPTVLAWHDGGWREVALEFTQDGRVRESLLPGIPDDLNATALDPAVWPEGAPPDGQRVEIHDSFRRWQSEWLPSWSGGDLLWIDYGADFPGLYTRRPRGTLRAYAHHHRLEGMQVFRQLGRQDITCDVNFTDIRRWGEQVGLHTVHCLSLGTFLERFAPEASNDPAANPGPAEAFRVLWMRR